MLQVCESLVHPETRNRELAALREAMREQGLGCGVIVTREESEALTVEEGHISVIPVWLFLLSFAG